MVDLALQHQLRSWRSNPSYIGRRCTSRKADRLFLSTFAHRWSNICSQKALELAQDLVGPAVAEGTLEKDLGAHIRIKRRYLL